MKEIGFREKESCLGEHDMELVTRDRCNGTAIEDGRCAFYTLSTIRLVPVAVLVVITLI